MKLWIVLKGDDRFCQRCVSCFYFAADAAPTTPLFKQELRSPTSVAVMSTGFGTDATIRQKALPQRRGRSENRQLLMQKRRGSQTEKLSRSESSRWGWLGWNVRKESFNWMGRVESLPKWQCKGNVPPPILQHYLDHLKRVSQVRRRCSFGFFLSKNRIESGWEPFFKNQKKFRQQERGNENRRFHTKSECEWSLIEIGGGRQTSSGVVLFAWSD